MTPSFSLSLPIPLAWDLVERGIPGPPPPPAEGEKKGYKRRTRRGDGGERHRVKALLPPPVSLPSSPLPHLTRAAATVLFTLCVHLTPSSLFPPTSRLLSPLYAKEPLGRGGARDRLRHSLEGKTIYRRLRKTHTYNYTQKEKEIALFGGDRGNSRK